MPEADVVYSDVSFTKSKEKTTDADAASSLAESAYSEIKILKTEPTTELPGPQKQAVSSCQVMSERMAIAVLSALLAAAVILLSFIIHQNVQILKHLQDLTAVNKTSNFKTERRCEVKTYNTVLKMCPDLNISQTCLKCEEGWELYGTQCYYFSTDASQWEESRNTCKNHNADLVQIDSEDEQKFLELSLRHRVTHPEDKFWIGLTDVEEEGTWLWVDGSQLNDSLAFWFPTEPDDWQDKEDCVRMGEAGGSGDVNCWYDMSCTDTQKSICEKSAETGQAKCV